MTKPESPVVVELPDDAIKAAIRAVRTAPDDTNFTIDDVVAYAVRAAEPIIAACARAEAIAAERRRIENGLLEEFYEDNPQTDRDHGYNAGIRQAIWVMESGFAIGSVPVAGEPEVVAWAVRAADGMVYVPGDSPIQAGTKKQAELVAARNQGKGGVWSVVPLVAGSVPVATPPISEHQRRHEAYGTWPCAWHGDSVCPILHELSANPTAGDQT